MLQPNGLLEDTGFGYSPHDYLDLLETLQSVATLGQQQVLAEGLKEALWRRDGRRRTYFCCLYSPGPHPHLDPRRADWSKFDPVVGCGKRLLDVNELKQHVAACKHHGRLCLRLGLCSTDGLSGGCARAGHPCAPVERRARIATVEAQIERRKQLEAQWQAHWMPPQQHW